MTERIGGIRGMDSINIMLEDITNSIVVGKLKFQSLLVMTTVLHGNRYI